VPWPEAKLASVITSTINEVCSIAKVSRFGVSDEKSMKVFKNSSDGLD